MRAVANDNSPVGSAFMIVYPITTTA
jgi:hypothetical protein